MVKRKYYRQIQNDGAYKLQGRGDEGEMEY